MRATLTHKQKAVAAEKLANCTNGQNAKEAVQNCTASEKTSMEQAAKSVGVSRRSVATVREFNKLKAEGKLTAKEIAEVEAVKTNGGT